MSWIEFNPEPNFRDSPKTATGRVPTPLKFETMVSGGSLWTEKRPLLAASGLDHQTSVRSAISKASSTSIPRYLTVLSNLLCPSSN